MPTTQGQPVAGLVPKSGSCIIVDAYSSGDMYAPLIRRTPRYTDLSVVHVQSRREIPSAFGAGHRAADFCDNIVHDASREDTWRKVAKHDPVCILPGTESGVELADWLSERAHIATNGTAQSTARRDKYAMVEALRQANVNRVAHCKSTSADELVAWSENNGFPVVVKPLRSAGGDSVERCESPSAVREAFDSIYMQTNKLGEVNDEVLVQSFLEGVEYIVNTVSCEGQHCATDIWRYAPRIEANGSSFVYDRGDLLRGNGTEEQELASYVFSVLDALHIKYGPAHAEVMLTRDGPVLVEIGARPCGSHVPEVCNDCVGYNQIELALDSYLDPQYFYERYPTLYSARKLAMGMYFVAYRAGKIVDTPGLRWIELIPGRFRTDLFGIKDGWLKKTVDLLTTPGIVEFIDESPDILDQRHAEVRAMEKYPGFWDLGGYG